MTDGDSNSNAPQPHRGEEENSSLVAGQQKAARKFLQGTAQTLIQYMPMGGSGWVLLSFAKEQDWLMAILMFPVMGTSVVWAAYTKSVLERLAEIYLEKRCRCFDGVAKTLRSGD